MPTLTTRALENEEQGIEEREEVLRQIRETRDASPGEVEARVVVKFQADNARTIRRLWALHNQHLGEAQARFDRANEVESQLNSTSLHISGHALPNSMLRRIGFLALLFFGIAI